MGKRGPKRTPTNILKLRGSRRVETRPKNEPVPAKGIPNPPEWLDEIGLQEWYKWVSFLYEQGTLNLIDANMLGYYCDAHSDFINAKNNSLDKNGKTAIITETKNGNIITNPFYAAKRKARAEAASLAAEFGMSPSARTSINVPGKSNKSQTSAQKWLLKQSGA